MNDHGNLVTSEYTLKKLYLETYIKRLMPATIKEEMKDGAKVVVRLVGYSELQNP